jgi:hypothetical protein
MLESKTHFAFIRRRWRAILIEFLVFVGLSVAADAFVGSIYRSRIAAAVRAGVGADLRATSAWYLPLRGVSLHGVRLTKTTVDGRRVELFRASRVDLKLQPMPKDERATVASEKYRIRYAKMVGGKFTYAPPGREPLVLDGIDLELSPSGAAPQLYRFFVDAGTKDASPVRSAGAIDLDQHTLAIAELSLRVKLDAALSRIPLSDSTRKKLEQYLVGGTFDIRGSASIPLNDWRAAKYKADVKLSSAKFVSPDGGIRADRIDGEIEVDGDREKETHVALHQFKATAGSTSLLVDGGNFATTNKGANWKLTELLGRLDIGGGIPAFDRVKLHGRLNFTGKAAGPMQLPRNATVLTAVQHEFVAYPVDIAVQPPKFPSPVDHITGGPIRFQSGVVRFENLSGDYGGDKVVLDEGHVTLDDPRQKIQLQDLRRQIRMDGLIGTLVCRQPGPVYPAGLGKVIAQLRPTGSFAIGGWYAINRKLPEETARPKPDYFFRVSTAGGAFALTDRMAPLTDIRADATVSPMLVDIVRLRGKTLGGEVIAATQFTPGKPMRYAGVATFYNVNLDTAWQELGMPMKSPLTGAAYFKIRGSGIGRGGTISPLQAVAADGEFEIVDGNFGDITAVRAAAKPVSKTNQTLDGRAAGVFSLRDGKVTLENCVVGNPIYGLQGSGTIGLDKSLDLHVVAAPLGDWQLALKQNNAGGLAVVAGSIQRLFNGAQHLLLYDVHVTGPATHPTVAPPTPCPIITAPIAAVFEQLMGGSKDTKLIDQLRPRTEPTTQDSQTAQLVTPKSK